MLICAISQGREEMASRAKLLLQYPGLQTGWWVGWLGADHQWVLDEMGLFKVHWAKCCLLGRDKGSRPWQQQDNCSRDSEDLPAPSVPFPPRQKWQQPEGSLLRVPLYLPRMVPWQCTPGCLLAPTPEPLIIHNFGKMFPQGDNWWSRWKGI